MVRINLFGIVCCLFVPFVAQAGIAVAPPSGVLDERVIEGAATIIDGDTIDIGGLKIRLAGVDSMERHQECRRDGKAWACGREAKAWLERFIAGAAVRCTRIDMEKTVPLIANCYNAGGVQLGWAMVNWGYAINDRVYAPNFAPSQRHAMRSRRGIWSGEFIEPVLWRRNRI